MKLALRTTALAYLGALVLVPLGMIFYRTFEHGFVAFWESVSTPAAVSAISLSLIIVAIVVPLNVVFGLVTALALARGDFRGKGLLQAVVDLPFAVSPVIVGVALILFWGSGGWLDDALPVIFSLPGMVLATTFVTLPFVVREVEPVLHEIGTEQEEAAATLGASKWQTFWRITLPAIRVGVDLRRGADRRPLARRVRRADRRRRRRARRVADADAARPRPLHRRPQRVRRLLGVDRPDGPRGPDLDPDDHAARRRRA